MKRIKQWNQQETSEKNYNPLGRPVKFSSSLPHLPCLPCSIPKDSAAYLTGACPVQFLSSLPNGIKFWLLFHRGETMCFLCFSIINRQSSINSHQSLWPGHQASIDNHQSSIINHQSSINNQQSTINSHQSPNPVLITFHL